MEAKVSEDKSSGIQSASISSSRSNISCRSTTSITRKREEDFTKDNAKAIDLECSIQAKRIIKIIDELMYKVKLAICLPLLIQHKSLSGLLDLQHYYEVTFIYKEYYGDHPNIVDEAAFEDLRTGNFSMNNRLHPELVYLVYILNNYPALGPVVDKMMKERHIYMDMNSPPSAMEYLMLLERFRDLMKSQLECTAEKKLFEELRIKELERSNAKHVARIDEYKSVLKSEMESFEIAITNKKNTMIKLKEELEMIESLVNAKLQKKILDSDRHMVVQSRTHEIRCEILKEDAERYKDEYEKALRADLSDEKLHRARRSKAATQLLSWLQKYDKDIGEKQTELEKLNELYDEESKLVEDLEKKLAEQDKEYLSLMAEKDEEYHQEMAKKEMMFKVDHAARVIQYAWRRVLANRALKKRLRKKLQKMQEAIAAEKKRKRKK